MKQIGGMVKSMVLVIIMVLVVLNPIHTENIIKMVQYVIDSIDHFEEVEIRNQFIIDFYKWCGVNNPEMEN